MYCLSFTSFLKIQLGFLFCSSILSYFQFILNCLLIDLESYLIDYILRFLNLSLLKKCFSKRFKNFGIKFDNSKIEIS